MRGLGSPSSVYFHMKRQGEELEGRVMSLQTQTILCLNVHGCSTLEDEEKEVIRRTSVVLELIETKLKGKGE